VRLVMWKGSSNVRSSLVPAVVERTWSWIRVLDETLGGNLRGKYSVPGVPYKANAEWTVLPRALPHSIGPRPSESRVICARGRQNVWLLVIGVTTFLIETLA
jgi:hypothetical protein